ncbi:hypothetical protein RvY_02885 [Ramazzottius varieornatus]|uniref:Uncharacterized protein n=1 Tax=Ramazzottius varieornatus TaxID=947166 RepID=A0A1D1UTA0_RAMVA|nr:hypothetical protein RvY_02885 [Ramazzottius varieornatus]
MLGSLISWKSQFYNEYCTKNNKLVDEKPVEHRNLMDDNKTFCFAPSLFFEIIDGKIVKIDRRSSEYVWVKSLTVLVPLEAHTEPEEGSVLEIIRRKLEADGMDDLFICYLLTCARPNNLGRIISRPRPRPEKTLLLISPASSVNSISDEAKTAKPSGVVKAATWVAKAAGTGAATGMVDDAGRLYQEEWKEDDPEEEDEEEDDDEQEDEGEVDEEGMGKKTTCEKVLTLSAWLRGGVGHKTYPKSLKKRYTGCVLVVDEWYQSVEKKGVPDRFEGQKLRDIFPVTDSEVLQVIAKMGLIDLRISEAQCYDGQDRKYYERMKTKRPFFDSPVRIVAQGDNGKKAQKNSKINSPLVSNSIAVNMNFVYPRHKLAMQTYGRGYGITQMWCYGKVSIEH